ncbi:radical SAM protein [Nanoarchaeota archaeon]
MKYQEAIKQEMEKLSQDEKTVFVGYNISHGSKAYGTLTDVPENSKLETPLAENLMCGLAMGLALEGFKPVLFFERHDFLFVAMDALVNHIDKIESMSKGQFKLPMIIRAIVGSTQPLDPGPQHKQDLTELLKKTLNFPVYEVNTVEEIKDAYKKASEFIKPVMIIERKNLYNTEFSESEVNLQESKIIEASQETNKEKLILDSHKVEWHPERVNAWLRGEKVAPITIDCALTRRCNFNCVYCYGQLQENDELKMTKEVIFRFLKDAADIGVKAVSFVSDGESACSPHVYDAIVYGKQQGLDMALGTNGAPLKKERLHEILPHLTYLRFNISAGEPRRFAEIMGCREEDFHKVCEIIKECVRLKKENNWDVTIGTQMVLMPNFKDQIIPLAKLGKELGVDYLVIKHCSDDECGSLGVNYERYFEQDLIDKIKQAEAMSTDSYQVSAKWSKILSHGKRKYTKCFGPPFILQMSGSGLVAPCGMLFNEKYKKFHIGNIAEKSFKEIWQSDKYWRVMNHLASDEFNAQTDCGTLCLQHKVNEYLWDLKKRTESGENIFLNKPEGKEPMHVNFI